MIDSTTKATSQPTPLVCDDEATAVLRRRVVDGVPTA
jgi:hypothetical protein